MTTKIRTILVLLSLSCSPAMAIPIVFNFNVPFTISSPGAYYVGENIGYTPSANTPCITINASDVTLDLMGFTLTQVLGLGFSVTGIQIAADAVNTTIRNGAIDGFVGSAISAANGTSQTNISNIEVFNCGQRGIEFVGTTADPINNAEMTNCAIYSSCTVSSADNVLTLSNVNDFSLNNCIFNSNGSTVISGTFVVVKLTNFNRNQIQNIYCAANQGNFDARGFSCNNTNEAQFISCVINGITASGGGSSAQGFVLESDTSSLNGTCTANVFQNCLVNNITGTNTVDGVFSGSGCNNNSFFGCIVQNLNATNVSGIASAYRIVNNNRNLFTGCFALTTSASTNNTTATPLYAAHGFKFDTTVGSSCLQCVANDINGKNTGTSGRGVGFFWINTQGCTATKCEANRCVFGFDLFATQAAGITSNSVLNCFSQKNANAGYNNFANNSIVATPPQTLNAGAINGIINMGIT